MARISADDDTNRRIDGARRLIGTTLVVLLIAIVFLGFAALFTGETGGVDPGLIRSAHSREDVERLTALARIAAEASKANADRLALLLNIVFGPVVTLLGSVTGFYFGTQTRRRP